MPLSGRKTTELDTLDRNAFDFDMRRGALGALNALL